MFDRIQPARIFLGLINIFLFSTNVSRSQAPPKLEFDVASVKPAAPQANIVYGTRGGPGTPDPGRITYTSVTLRLLLANAYDVLDDQISGPAWLGSERYDIAATVPTGATKEQLRVMLQNLLAERFRVKFHREKKDFLVYELVIAKSGSKLKASVTSSAAAVPTPAAGGRTGASDDNGFPRPPSHQTAQRATSGVAKMAGNQITMTALAQFLKFPIGFITGGPLPAPARVVDKTELAGEFDVTLEYQWPVPVATATLGKQGPETPLDSPSDLAPTIFTALQQQLGLRLQQTKEPFDVLVIENAEKVPTEN